MVKTLRKTPQEKLSLGKSLLWIIFSTLCVSGVAFLGLVYWRHVTLLRVNDERFKIIAVIQTGPEKEALKTVYLEELLGLSMDHPTNLYEFDTLEAQHKLVSSPLIKKALVKKVKPGTVYIDYSVRQPVAFIGDYTNTAIDAEGVLIPFKPFFTPKKIPEIYLGLHGELGTSEFGEGVQGNPIWGTALNGARVDLAYDLLERISTMFGTKTPSYIRHIDVSRAYADSYGQRQIIVVLEDWFEKEKEGKSILCIFPRIVRLSTANYQQELKDFMELREYLQKQELHQIVDSSQTLVKAEPMIIDMRIPQLAFFKE